MLKIPPDYTFVLEIVIFVLLWMVMKRWWFEPALRVILERSARSEGAVREARAVQAEAERLRSEHAAALDEARDEARREVQDILRAAEEEQRRLIADAREEAQRTLADVRSRIAEDLTAARQGLGEQAGAIAREVAHKVLGRAV
jgi:F-type H+-transporting ATPase subunit b